MSLNSINGIQPGVDLLSICCDHRFKKNTKIFKSLTFTCFLWPTFFMLRFPFLLALIKRRSVTLISFTVIVISFSPDQLDQTPVFKSTTLFLRVTLKFRSVLQLCFSYPFSFYVLQRNIMKLLDRLLSSFFPPTGRNRGYRPLHPFRITTKRKDYLRWAQQNKTPLWIIKRKWNDRVSEHSFTVSTKQKTKTKHNIHSQ